MTQRRVLPTNQPVKPNITEQFETNIKYRHFETSNANQLFLLQYNFITRYLALLHRSTLKKYRVLEQYFTFLTVD